MTVHISYRFLCTIFFLSAFSPSSGFAYSDHIGEYSVSGRVLDAQTGQSLAGAHVFLEASTIGTVTDEAGAFTLTNLPPGQQHIGVSMIGYTTHSIHVRIESAGGAADHLAIELQPNVYEMEAVTVTAKRNRRWKKQFGAFKRGVIGETHNAGFTTILNPEVLEFKQRHGILYARAAEPLVIDNKALGYRIYYALIHCVMQDKRYQFKGVARFEEMEPRNKRERRLWENNRKASYKGSFKHLLQTLAFVESVDEIEAQGFQISLADASSNSSSRRKKGKKLSETSLASLVHNTERGYERQLQFDGQMVVSYPGEVEHFRGNTYYSDSGRHMEPQVTSLHFRKDSVRFHTEGFLIDAYNITIQGYMGRERLADMLPLDYVYVD